MAGKGRRAEDFARFKQYDYVANSNLVLTAEQRKSGRAEPDGTGESLAAHALGQMGDRAKREAPEELEAARAKRREKERREARAGGGAGRPGGGGGAPAAGPGSGGSTSFAAMLDAGAGSYAPRTRETREAYETLLSVLGQALGDQPSEVLRGAAEEVVGVLRDGERGDTERRAEVAELLGPIPDDRYAALVELGRRLTDWVGPQDLREGRADGVGAPPAGDALDQDLGVAVQFEDESEEEGQDELVPEVVDEDEEDDVGGDEESRGDGNAAPAPVGAALGGPADGAGAAATAAGAGAAARGDAATVTPAREIDAYWLQRKISTALGPGTDAAEAQRLAEAALRALDPRDARATESRLVALLGFKHFALVRALVRERSRVRACTLLARADGPEERARAEAEASESAEGREALAELRASRASARDRQVALERGIREEAARLGGGARVPGPAGLAAPGPDVAAPEAGAGADASPETRAPRELDLDSLAALAATVGEQAALKTVALPEGSYRTAHKGYEEVRVPPPPRASRPDDELVPISDLPAWARPAFPGMKSLNAMQSKAYRAALFGADNFLLCAPTGAGKTNVALLAILAVLGVAGAAEPAAPPAGGRADGDGGATGGGDAGGDAAELDAPIRGDAGEAAAAAAAAAADASADAASSVDAAAAPGSAFKVPDPSLGKVVYIAPMKALVVEVVGNLSRRLAPLGAVVAELTGDRSLTGPELAAAHVIVATPEKWDVVTRNSADRQAARAVKLLILDEIHLLHDPRGSVLEALVARALRDAESSPGGAARGAAEAPTRLLGLSATLPNPGDVAAFLRAPASSTFVFDAGYRPCPLQLDVVGVSARQPLQRFKLMNEICHDKVLDSLRRGHACLVFVHSRKETASTGRYLRDRFLEAGELGALGGDASGASAEVLRGEAPGADSGDLRDLLPHGVAVHHAGMTRADRTLVEDLFADGHARVLVCTATLAWGVNLPAHTVVIKGTQVYSPAEGAWTELSHLDAAQMLGRAGRPQYDTHGEGVIITQHSRMPRYLGLFTSSLPVESRLLPALPDALNAEVALGNVDSLDEAARWIRATYLHVRTLSAPASYGVAEAELARDPRLAGRRRDLAHAALCALDSAGLVRYDRRAGASSGAGAGAVAPLRPTDLGRIAARFYVSHETVSGFERTIRPSMGDIELLRAFCSAREFQHVVVREEEKLELARLLDRVPVPVKEPVDDPAAKVNALLQAHVSRLRLDGMALAADAAQVSASGARLLRCLHELALRRGWSRLALRALRLAKCVAARMWSCQTPLRQFPGVPEDALARIERKELPWERWRDLSAREIGELLRLPRAGKTVHRLVHSYPRLELEASVHPISRSLLSVDLTITPDFAWDWTVHGGSQRFLLLVEDSDCESVLHAEPWVLRGTLSDRPHSVSLALPLPDPPPPAYHVRLVSDTWLGPPDSLAVPLRHLTLPDRAPPPRELLDLAPLEREALRDPALAELYPPGIAFGPALTQAFAALFDGDDHALFAAPAGASAHVAGEWAFLRLARRAAAGGDGAPRCRAVYVAPDEAVADLRYADWRIRFGEGGLVTDRAGGGDHAPYPVPGLGLRLLRLTGDGAADAAALASANLAVGTPEEWDAVSRRWRTRRAVQAIELYIFDGLHLLGRGRRGAVLEAVVSRARAAGKALPAAARLVGLSAPLAPARDVADWLGAPPSATFAFAPSARDVPLDVRVTPLRPGDDLDLARPTRQALARVAPGSRDTAIVYAPDRRGVREAARDAAAWLAAAGGAAAAAAAARDVAAEDDVAAAGPVDGEGSMAVDGEVAGSGDAPAPLGIGDEQAESLRLLAATVSDRGLAAALRAGVAFVHPGQSRGDREAAVRAFASGAARAFAAPLGEAWGLSLGARGVVVRGTRSARADGTQGADAPLADVAQALGSAGRRGADRSAGAALLCAAPRRSYYSRYLHEPLPLESALDTHLADVLLGEVVGRGVESAQDAVDWLTWTLYYRRLARNPNYYGAASGDHRATSDHLSDLVERALGDLEAAGAVELAEDPATGAPSAAPRAAGAIAAHYGVGYATLEAYAASLGPKTKLRGLLEALAAATEYDDLPVLDGDGPAVAAILRRAPLAPSRPPRAGDPHAKAFALLQAHLSRTRLDGRLDADRGVVVAKAPVLLAAAVDVLAAAGALTPALAAMELSQMVVQARWARDSPLTQVPGISRAVAARAEREYRCETVFDLAELPRAQLAGLLRPTAERELRLEFERAARGGSRDAAASADVPAAAVEARTERLARAAEAWLASYPDVAVAYDLRGAVRVTPPGEDDEGDETPLEAEVEAGATLTVEVALERGGADEPGDPERFGRPVPAPRFPKDKRESWWVALGDPRAGQLLAIKRVHLLARARTKLSFSAPDAPGTHDLTLYLMSDAVMGADQEFSVRLDVRDSGEGEDAQEA